MWEMRIAIFHLVWILSIYLWCTRERRRISVYDYGITCAISPRFIRAQLLYSFDWKWTGSNRISAICFFFVIQKINGAHQMVCTFERKVSIISFEMPMRTKLSITFVKLVGIIDVEHGSLMMLIHINLLFGDI